MSEQQTLWNIPSAIGSLEEDSGVTRSGRPDGPTTGKCGREAAPAPALAQRAKGKGLQTLVTSGLNGHGSSASAALQQSLESRLLPRLDTAGSTLFQQTWRRKATPLRRRYWEHTASARRTSGSGFTLQDSCQPSVLSFQLAAITTPSKVRKFPISRPC